MEILFIKYYITNTYRLFKLRGHTPKLVSLKLALATGTGTGQGQLQHKRAYYYWLLILLIYAHITETN
jgi:hypothetical protein